MKTMTFPTIRGYVAFCLVAAIQFFAGNANGQIVWSSPVGNAWTTGSNWTGSAVPGTSGWAQFGATGTSTSVLITMNGSNNNGANNQAVGAIDVTSARTVSLNISSVVAFGILTLNGATVSGTNNVIMSNSMPNNGLLFSLGSPAMRLAIPGATNKNIMTVGGSSSTVQGGTINITDTISGTAPLTFLGGGSWNGSTGNAGGLLRLGAGQTFSGGVTVGKSDSTQSGVFSLDAITSMANTSGNDITINPMSELLLNSATGTYTTGNIALNLNGTGNLVALTTPGGALVTKAGTSYTWTGPINLASNASIYTIGNGTLTASGNISGSGALIKTSSTSTGTINLTGTSNSWGGGTQIGAGAIIVASGSSISTGSLAMTGLTTGVNSTITFNNTSQTITGLSSSFVPTSGTQVQNVILSSGHTLTLNQSGNTMYGSNGTVTTQTSVLTGAGALIKNGAGILTLSSNGNTISGGLTVNNGEIRHNPRLTTTVNMSSCPVTLNGGKITTTNDTKTAQISLGVLTLTANSTIDLGVATAHNVKFANSSAVSWTASTVLNVTGWQGSFNGTTGTKGRLFIGTTSGGVTAGQLAQIQFTDAGGHVFPAIILSTGEIVPKAGITTTVAGYGPFSNSVSNVISVGFTSTGPFSANFRVQLSDASGAFTADTTTDIIGTGATSPISATIPSGTATGANYRVRVINGSPVTIFGNDNGSGIVLLVPCPTITLVSPNTGIPGASVTLTGTNFNTTGTNNIVYFGATKATVTSSGSSTSLTVTIPADATYAPLSVLNTGLDLMGNQRLSFTPTYTTTYLTAGQINFSAYQTFSTGSAPFISAIGDLDGDGKSDMVTPNSSGGNISVFRNTSATGSITASSFASPGSFTVLSTPTNVKLEDIDGDGKLDVVVVCAAVATVCVFRNTSSPGSISFATRVDISTGGSGLGPIEVTAADYDGDGRPDIAASASFSNTVTVLHNASSPGSISFSAAVAFATNVGPFGITSADFDGDGKIDIAVVDTGSATVSVLRNTATPGSITSGSFATAVDFAVGTSPVDIEVGDIDGDGKIDIVASNSNANSISVLRNTSSSGSITSGSFASTVNFSTGTSPSGLAVGDIDGDGKADIAVSNAGSNTVSVFRNTASSGSITSGSLATRVDFNTATGPQGLSIGDLDGDGKPDIAVACVSTNQVSVLRNFRQPNVSAITGTTTVCVGASTALADGTTGGAWALTNTSLATINTSGLVTGIAGGSDTATYTIIVSGDTTVVSTPLTINPLAVPGTITGTTTVCVLATTALIDAAGGGTWSSSATSRATIDGSGNVTGVSSGTATISYAVTNTCGTQYATTVVTVNPLPATPAAITGPTAVGIGGTISLIETVGGGTWSSVTPSVATVNTTGDVTGVTLGSAVISYAISNSCGTNAVTATVNVGGGTFYSKSTGNLNTLATWGTNTDGTGTSPSGFTFANQTFNIRNGNSGTLTANWTVSGSSSKVVVEQTDLTITSSFSINAIIDVNVNRILTIQNTTLPTLGTMDETSTIKYSNGVSNTMQYTGTTYGNIIFDGSGTGVSNPGGASNLFFAGNFTLTSSATFVAGNITIVTTGTLDQIISGNGNTFTCYAINNNYTGGKTGKLTLASSTTITVVELQMNISGSANQFIDGGNTIIVNNVYCGGNAAAYSLSGTLTLAGGIIADNTGSTASVAVFNNITVNVSGSSSVHFYPTSGSATTTIAGNFTVTAMGSGLVRFSNNTINIGGDFTHTPSTLVINFGNSAVNFYGGTSTTYFSNITTTGVSFYNLYITKTSGGTLTFGSGPITINNTFHIVSAPTGSITLGTSFIYLYGDFTHSPSNETFTSTGNTFVFAGSGTQVYSSSVTTNGSTFNNVVVNKSGGTITINNNISIFNNFTITAAPASCIDFGSHTVNIGGDFTHTPTTLAFIYGTSTFNFYGGSSTTYVSNITTTGTTFYNVTINKSSGGSFSFGTDPVTINNNFVITAAPAGSVTLGTSYIYLYGNFTHTPSTESFVSTGNTFVFTGTNTQTYTSSVTTSGNTFNNIIVDKSGGTITINSNISIFNNFTISAAPSSCIAFGAHTVNIGGNFTNTPAVETINYGTSTVNFYGSTATTYASSVSGTGSGFKSISITKTSGGSFDFGTDPITINGNLTIVSAPTGSITLGTSTIYLYGNFNHTPSTESFISTGNTFVFAGGGSQTYTTGITGTTGSTFNNFEIDKSGGTLTFNNSINIVGNYTVTAAGSSSIFFGSNTINVVGNFTHTPATLAINAGTSTVNFYGTSATTYVSNVTATGMVFYNVTINKASGGTLTFGSDNVTINGNYTITVADAGSITLGTGTIFLLGNFVHTPSTESFIHTGNTFVFKGSGTQTYTTGITGTGGNTFNDFIINKTGGSLTFNNSITIVGNYTITAAATNSIVFGSNTINIIGDFTHTPTNQTINAGTSTVIFYGGTSTTYVSNISAGSGVIFYNVTINKSSGGTLTFGSDNVTINGDFTITTAPVGSITLGTGSIFLLGDFIHTPATETFINTGNTFVFSGSGTQSYTTNITGTTGNTFNNITINKSGGSFTLNNSITIVGNYVISAAPSAGIVFGSNTINVGGNFTHTPATLAINAGSSTVIFYGATAGVYFSNISGTGVAFNNVTINKLTGGTFSFGTSPVTVGGDFYVQGAPSGSITLGTGSIFLTGNFNHAPSTESFVSTGNTFVFTGSGTQTYTTGITGTSGSTFNNITINKAAGTLTLNNSITINGHYVVTDAPALGIVFGSNTINVGRNFTHTPSSLSIDFGTSTVILFGGNAGVYSTNIVTTGVTFYNLTINKTAGGTFTFGSSPYTVGGDFHCVGAPSGSITLGTGAFYLYGNFTHDPSTESFVSTGNTFVFVGTGTQTYTTSITGATGSTFNNITVNKSGGSITFNNSISINGDFLVTAAPSSGIVFGSNTINFGGDFTHTPSALAINFGTSTCVFNGATAQVYLTNVSGGHIFYNLIINNSSTGVTLNTNLSVSNTFTLTLGKVITGSNYMHIMNTGSVSGGSLTSYVNGRLSKAIPSSPVTSMLFEVGDNTYAPMRFAFNGSGASAGQIIVRSVAGSHASLATSFISASHFVNRYWSVQYPSTVTAGAFPTKDSFSYSIGDITGAASNAGFIVRQYDGSAWSNAGSSTNLSSVSAPLLANATVAGNEASTGTSVTTDFVIGQPTCSATGGTAAASPTHGCPGTSSNLSLSGASTGGGTTYQWKSSPTGTTWSSVSGATTATLNTGTVSTTTHYHCVVTCSVSGLSDSSSDVVYTIDPLPATPAPITGTTTLVTLGASTTLTDTTSGGVWSSSNTAVATVSLSGVVTSVASGTAIITYTVTNSCGSANDTALVAVITSNHAPYFSYGSIINVSLCSNFGAFPMNNPLKMKDVDTGQTLTITLISGPAHGVASVAYSATSTGTYVIPAGLSYTPATGYVGSDSIVVRVSDGLVTATSTIRLTVNPLPAVPVISGATTLCLAASTTLIGTPSGGTWYHYDGNTSVTAGGVVTAIGGGSSIIRYQSPANVYGCKTMGYDTLILIGTPSAGSIAGSNSVCPGSSTTLTPSIAGGSWASSNTSLATITGGGSVTGVATGAVAISYTVNNGCFSSTAIKNMTILGATTPGAINGIPYLCEAATLTLTNSLSGGNWSSTNTAVAMISGLGVVSGIAAGTDTIIYSFTNACGITASVRKTVSVLALPVAGIISGPSTVLTGGNITLVTTGTGGVWSSVTPAFATVNTAGVVHGVAVGVDTIKYRVTNTCGTGTATKVVTVTSSRMVNNNGQVVAGTEGEDIQLYPNPTSGTITVDIPGTTGTNAIMVTDMSGKVVITQFTEDAKVSLDLSSLAAGTYQINVNNGTKLFTQKIMLQ